MQPKAVVLAIVAVFHGVFDVSIDRRDVWSEGVKLTVAAGEVYLDQRR